MDTTRCPWFGLFLFLLAVGLTNLGCASHSQTLTYAPEDQFGRTYYIDGAGNWGYGVREVPAGLRRAGYNGRVIVFQWSPFHNPALDQTIGRTAARAKGEELADEIAEYLECFPEREVNIIALSAGTGVAVWACENLQSAAKISNLVLLGSSLSSTYDMSKALAHIDGRVFVYHSDKDAILGLAVPFTGTIDGGSRESAGLVGLRPFPTEAPQIQNISWSPEHARLGWSGSHTSSTAELFVSRVLAAHVVDGPEDLYASAGSTYDQTDR